MIQLRILAGLVAIAAMIGAYVYGRHDGRELANAFWQAREAQIQADVQAVKDQAAERVREAEKASAARVVAISADYQADLQRLNDEKDALLSDVRAGRRRLSIPATCDAGGGAPVPGAAAGTGGRDGEARAELSGEAADFLVALASEADRVARQLDACQQVIRADRAQRPP